MSTLRRYDPLRLLEEFDQAFSQGWNKKALADPSSVATSAWSPEVDISETAEKFQLHMDLPGVKKDDIDVSMEGNVLTVRGKKESKSEDHSTRYHRTERVYGEFHRQFSLPDTADGHSIAANFKDGVLDIAIPKVEKKQSKKIEIGS